MKHISNLWITPLAIVLFSTYVALSQPDSVYEAWVARYNGPVDGYDIGVDVGVDGSGNVYVTGSSTGRGTSTDYATIKYDASGAQQWVAWYNGPGNLYDNPNQLAVDPSGNVYVTGYSWAGTDYDYATIKYDPFGSEQWVARYNGPGNQYDQAYDLAVDGSGNVYVTGYSYGSDTYNDYVYRPQIVKHILRKSFDVPLWPPAVIDSRVAR